nr:unnamed protein product [Digitaria exilis]
MASSPAAFHLRHPPRLRFLLLSSSPISTSTTTSSSSSSSPYPWLSVWSRPGQRSRLRAPASALDLRPEPSPSSDSDDEDAVGTSRSSGRSTMSLILHRLRRAGFSPEGPQQAAASPPPHPPRGSVEDVFRADDGVLPNARGGFDPEEEEEEGMLGDARFPWERPMPPPEAAPRASRSPTWLAELTLPAAELRRLRHAAIRMKSRTKVGGAGVTRDIVEKIREKWKTEEVVRVKVSGTPALNMRLFHEILERKTGGLVIWRSGTSVSLYRGVDYDEPEPTKGSNKSMKFSIKGSPSPSLQPTEKVDSAQDSNGALVSKTGKEEIVEQVPEIKYEDEIDKLLDELGPRYSDWPGSDPLPVDADLLPATIPGRSRQLQGLANAMVKLWEKSSIVKIALKRGVQLTTSERMAEDIKKLTGGVMLSRNIDFIVFYRGKDFLSSELQEVLLERERLAKSLQDEEQARLNAASSFSSSSNAYVQPSVAGTLEETLEANSKYGKQLNDGHADKMARTVAAARHADVVRKLEWKLARVSDQVAIILTRDGLRASPLLCLPTPPRPTPHRAVPAGPSAPPGHPAVTLPVPPSSTPATPYAPSPSSLSLARPPSPSMDWIRLRLRHTGAAGPRPWRRRPGMWWWRVSVDATLRPCLESEHSWVPYAIAAVAPLEEAAGRASPELLQFLHGWSFLTAAAVKTRVDLAQKKMEKAERVLGKVETALKPTDGTKSPETITDEERFMFRKLGLRMKAFLLLGRRGVFDGTIENMHLHWKYRELVKILVKSKSFSDVKRTALSLEAESGGILVSVDKVSKGYAIVVFRGKNYRRPSKLRPGNLLSKRKALARSIELQRHQALSQHYAKLNKKVEKLRAELVQMEGVKEQGDEELYAKLDSAYSSDDEDDMEDEDDDEVYLRRFDDEVAGATAEDAGDVHDEADYPDSEDDESVGDYSDDDEEEEDDDAYGTPDGGFSSEADFGREEYYRFEGGRNPEYGGDLGHETIRGSRADEQQRLATELTNTTNCS